MLTLQAIQAEHGDALLLQYGTPSNPRFLLVDGGPDGTFGAHLRPVLAKLPGGTLALVVVTHVDDDHAIGIVDLLADMERRRIQAKKPLVRIEGIWLNAFSRTLGADLLGRLSKAVDRSPQRAAILGAVPVLAAIPHGSGIAGYAEKLSVPLNAGFAKALVSTEAPAPFESANLSLKVLGPTPANLAGMKKAWRVWLDRNQEEIESGEIEVTRMDDRTPANLSSITLLAEAHGKRVLLAGDGRGDHLRDALEAGGCFTNGRAHLDVFKLPHHGSDRNVTKEILRCVTADHYVVCANGKDGNPDPPTLRWILAAAKEQERTFTLHATNRTPSIDEFAEEFPPAAHGWKLRVLPRKRHALTIELA